MKKRNQILIFLMIQASQVFNLCQAQCSVSISAQPSLNICSGQNTILTANPGGMAPFTYLWSTNATTSSISVNIPGIYSVSITDANECITSTSVEVVSQSLPSVGITTSGVLSGCVPLLVTFTIINFSQNDTSTIYTLNFGDGTPPLVMTHMQLLLNSMVSHTYYTPSVGLPGNMFVFQVSASNACGSANAMVSPIFVYSNPLVFNITGGGSFCQGGAGVPIGLNGAEAGVTYQLYRNNIALLPPVAGTGGPLSFGLFTVPGVYTVLATNILTNCSAAMSGSATIVIDPLPFADAGPDQSIPFGVITTLNGTASGGSGVLSFSWSPANMLSTGINTLTPGTTPLTTNTTYTLMVTDSKGCMASDQTTVSVSGSPLSVICSANTPGAVCYGTSLQLSASATGGSGVYTYQWSSFPAGWSSNLPNPVVMPLNSTTYTVVVTDGFNQASCGITITVNPIPNVLQPPPQSVCSGSATSPVYLSSSVPGTTFTWVASAAPALTGYIAAGTGNIPSQVIINTGLNTGAVFYNITPRANGCAGPPSNFAIQVVPLPSSSITGDTLACAGIPYIYSAQPGQSYYIWSISSGGIILSNSADQLTVQWLTTGLQTVTLSVANGYGCMAPNPSILPVRVNPPLTGQPVLNNMIIAAGQSVCEAAENILAGGSQFTAEPGSQVTLIASGSIWLLPGVHAASGSFLTAGITGNCMPCPTSKSLEDNRISEIFSLDGSSGSMPGEGLILVYPNPAENHVTLTFPMDGGRDRGPVSIAVFDASGRQLQVRNFQEATVCELSLEAYSPGVYIVRITTGSEVMVRRLIKSCR